MSIEMKTIIEEVLKESPAIHEGRISSLEHLAGEIAYRLIDAGYCKIDPYMLTFIDQLTVGLKDFQKNLNTIRENMQFLELTDEKVGRILNIIEHARQSMEHAGTANL